jgi:hypothetical protein
MGSLGSAPNGASAAVWDEIGAFVRGLTMRASARWVPELARRVPCDVPSVQVGTDIATDCDHFSIGQCDACGRPSCLAHARVDQAGGILCFVCVAEQIRIGAERVLQNPKARARARGRTRRSADPGAPPPPPPPSPQPPQPTAREIRRAALAELGLPEGASPAQIREAYAHLVKMLHPDHVSRMANAEERTAMTRRYQRVVKAYNWLKEHREAA